MTAGSSRHWYCELLFGSDDEDEVHEERELVRCLENEARLRRFGQFTEGCLDVGGGGSKVLLKTDEKISCVCERERKPLIGCRLCWNDRRRLSSLCAALCRKISSLLTLAASSVCLERYMDKVSSRRSLKAGKNSRSQRISINTFCCWKILHFPEY